ncbi:sensor histidine kinase [Nocardia sp. NPDC101769]|uniref:sensor histidine kinase n=1 Tax=Nocardia sp. NPDC101769 TaxID=3364333 RepID=UPI00381906D4
MWRIEQWQLWVLYILAGCIISVVILLLLDKWIPGHTVAAIVTIMSIPLWAALFGNRVFHGYLRRFDRIDLVELLFAAGVLILFTASICFSPSAISAETVIYPLLFMSMPLPLSLPASVVPAMISVVVMSTMDNVPPGFRPVGASIILVSVLIGPLVGIAIVRSAKLSERQRVLLQELAVSRAEAASLSHAAGISAERERLSREIHDTLAQGFVSVITLAEAIDAELGTRPELARRHLELIRATAQENLIEARAMVAELTPSALNGRPMREAIVRLTDQVARESGIAVQVVGGESLPRLDVLSEVALFRAIQEALTNARKHAGASAIVVEFTTVDEGILVAVSDDGAGFDPGEVEFGFGLKGMRDRIEGVGGMLTVSSRLGSGTTVKIGVVHDSGVAG